MGAAALGLFVLVKSVTSQEGGGDTAVVPTATLTAAERSEQSERSMEDANARRDRWRQEFIDDERDAAKVRRAEIAAEVVLPPPVFEEALAMASEIVVGNVRSQRITWGSSPAAGETYLISVVTTEDGDEVEVAQPVSLQFDADGTPVIAYLPHGDPLSADSHFAALVVDSPTVPGARQPIGDQIYELEDGKLEPLASSPANEPLHGRDLATLLRLFDDR
jgi:hypothetical protein